MRPLRFPSALFLPAFAAAMLMAVAPAISRWVQAMPAAMPAMVHAMPAETPHGDAHAGHHAMAAHAHRHGADSGPAASPSPADPHAAHGEACDYCALASQLLPWLLALLVLAPLSYRLAPQPPRAIRVPAGLRWPAHPARGPPLFS